MKLTIQNTILFCFGVVIIIACNQQKTSDSSLSEEDSALTLTTIDSQLNSIQVDTTEQLIKNLEQETQEKTEETKIVLTRKQQMMASIFLNKGKNITKKDIEGDLINDAIDHIHIEIKGECGGVDCGKEVYLINLHEEMQIQASIETVWGTKQNRSKDLRQYIVNTNSELKIGCNKWCVDEELIAFKRKMVAVLFIKPS